MTGPAPIFPVRPDAPDGEFTLRDLLRLVAKHGWVVLLCLLAGALVSAGIYAIQKPVYASVARVWVKTEQGSPSFLSGVTAYREPLYPDPVNRRIETEMELMLTRTSAAQVVRNLKVRPEQLPTTPLAQIIAATGLVAAKPVTEGAASNRLIDDFLKAVSVEPLRSKTADTTSNILEVRFEASDPALAPQALSQLISNYLGVAATQNRQLGEEAARLLGAEVEQARGELAALDAQIVALASRPPPRPAAEDGGGKRTRSERGERGERSSERRSRRENTFAGAPVGNEQALAALKTQTVEMQAELDALRELYTDDAENVRTLRRRLEAMQRRLAEGLSASVQAVSSLGSLERQRALAQDRYNEVQKKLDQIKLYLRLNPSDAESRVIVDAPSRPLEDEGKKRVVVALIGPVAGLLLGLLLAGLRELSDQRLQSRRDVRQALGLPVLGALPRLPAGERRRLAGEAR